MSPDGRAKPRGEVQTLDPLRSHDKRNFGNAKGSRSSVTPIVASASPQHMTLGRINPFMGRTTPRAVHRCNGNRLHAGTRPPLLWEHVFVTAQGSALTRFRRALERRHIFGAEIAAKEMAYVSLRDALDLVALYAAEDSRKYTRRRCVGSVASRSKATIYSSQIFNLRRPRYRRCVVDPTRRYPCSPT